MKNIAIILAISHLAPSTSALAVALNAASSLNLLPRQGSACGTDSTLSSCGADFPSDFCCPASTTCLPLNTTLAKAVICCPAGSDCGSIAPVSCEKSMQNATTAAQSQLHSDPLLELLTCGSACCPPGYACQGNMCITQPATLGSSSSSTTVLSSSATIMPSSSTSAPSSMSSSTEVPASTAISGNPAQPIVTEAPSNTFSGKSFAAGFLPGIVIGALLVAALLWCMSRRRRRDSYVDEKHISRDQLTDLSTMPVNRPTMHERSISEPVIDPSSGHRTDFLRTTPPRNPNLNDNSNGYTVDIHSPASVPRTPSRTPKIRALFSRSPAFGPSPFTPRPTQPPLPSHLKRGTLSHTVSPVRALKKQRSMHSLRRQMTQLSRGSDRPDISRQGSTETIQVLMPSNEPYTPDRRQVPVPEEPPATLSPATYQPPMNSASTWQTTSTASSLETGPTGAARYAPSSLYSRPQQSMMDAYPTPTRPSQAARGSAARGDVGARGNLKRSDQNYLANETGTGTGLGTPYTPSNNRYYGNNGKGKVTGVEIGSDNGLKVQREHERPMTTFSGLMEKAGILEHDLTGGGFGRR